MKLAEQILADASAWTLYGGRFVPRGRERDGAPLPTFIELDEGGAVAIVRLAGLPAAERARAAGALRRAGYEVKPQASSERVGRRALRGARGALAEARLLERLAMSPHAAALPRRARTPRAKAKAFPLSVLTALRDDERWTLQWIGASRRAAFRPVPGWNVLAACTAAVDDGETILDVSVQLSPTHPKADHAAAARALRALLLPEGYRVMRLVGARPPLARLVLMVKRVASVAGARRERKRLDAILFGA